jgi:hypothetical protein
MPHEAFRVWCLFLIAYSRPRTAPEWAVDWKRGDDIADGLSPKPPGGRGGGGSRRGGRAIPPGGRPARAKKTTLAAAAFLAGGSEALTRRAVEIPLAGDPAAMRLCLEHILPPSRERTVKFALPPIESAPTDRRLQELEDAFQGARRLGSQSRGLLGSTTDRRVFAADLLQMQQRETIGSILDCKSRPWPLAGRHAFCDHSRRDGGRQP